FLDLDIGAVERAYGQCAVERELHVSGARGFHAGRGNLLGQVGGRYHDLGDAHIVVRHEHDLQQAAHGRVAVNDLRNIVRKLDDELGVVIARRGFSAEEFYARGP